MKFPIETVRDQFPALAITDDGLPRRYLDNPAGTQVSRRVADAARDCLISTNANLGGFFSTSLAAEHIVERAHRAMAEFLGAASFREIVVGPSMTALTFQFARSLGRTLQAGDEIVVTRMDHDGNIGPWLTLAEERGLTVRWVPFDEESWTIEPAALEAVLSTRTRIVALNYANNLTGSINDLKRLARLVHEAGALAYVDAVQYAPHHAIDVRDIGCDFLTCSSYKFFGPHLGILWARESLLEELFAYKVRPQTSELPWKFERGTPQIEQLAALEATVGYFEWLGTLVSQHAEPREKICAAFASASAWERGLTRQLIGELRQLPGTRIIGISDPSRFDRRVPTVSFIHERRSPVEIARRLAESNIFVWTGHNFALETVRQLGIDEESGVVRIGLAHYNTPAEVESVLQALAN